MIYFDDGEWLVYVRGECVGRFLTEGAARARLLSWQ